MDVYNKSPKVGFENGVSSIPADRQKHGLVLEFSVEDNLILQNYKQPKFTKGKHLLNRDAVRKFASECIEKYDIRPRHSEERAAGTLSGGNQQKVIIAREVENDKDLLIAVNPTRGLDVGAIEYIHKQIVAQRDAGKAVLLVSLELDEVMNLADRILVMYEGEIVGQLDPETTTVQELGLYMAGAKRDTERGEQA